MEEGDDEKLPKLYSTPPPGRDGEGGATVISEVPADVYLRAAEAAEAREAAAGLVEVDAELELDEDEKRRSSAPTGPPAPSYQEPSVRIQALRVPRVMLDADDMDDSDDVDAFAPTRLHDVLTGAELRPNGQPPSEGAMPLGVPADPWAGSPAAPVPPPGAPPPSSASHGIPPALQAKHWPEPAFLSSIQAPAPSGVPWAIGGLVVGLVIVFLIGALIYTLVHN